MAAAFGSDRPDGSAGEPATVRRRRHLRRDSASRGDANVEDDRRDQQGCGGADLQGCRLRCRWRCLRSGAGTHERNSGSQEGALIIENVVFLFVLVVAAGFFALNVQRLVQYMRLGKAEDRSDRTFARVWNVLRVGIAQTKILREPVAGAMHATIFWGFLVLTAGTVELLIAGVFPTFTYGEFLPTPLFHAYEGSQDGFAILVLGAVAFAYYRRLVLHPRRLQGDNVEHLDAYIIL